jgi:hypothetical protein
MLCHDLWIGFPVVRDALRSADFTLSPDSLLPILFWSDSFVEQVPFSRLRPWQIIDRIPNSELLCNKVSLARAIRRLPRELRDFWPRTYILLEEDGAFGDELETESHTFIVKPATGSLGAGVRLYRPGRKLYHESKPGIVQVYINSFLYNSHRMDLRIYVLVTRVTPVEIYVYRNGITRICALSAGLDSRYSYLTNIAVNSTFPGELSGELLELLTNCFPKVGVDPQALWRGIDRIAILTVLSVYDQLLRGEREQRRRLGFTRCFQLFQFDILLDEQFKPWLLEVNYRPSLKYQKPHERRMKERLIADLATLFGNFAWVQEAVLARKYGWSRRQWEALMELHSGRVHETEANRDLLAQRTLFEQFWPIEDHEFAQFQAILDRAGEAWRPG